MYVRLCVVICSSFCLVCPLSEYCIFPVLYGTVHNKRKETAMNLNWWPQYTGPYTWQWFYYKKNKSLLKILSRNFFWKTESMTKMELWLSQEPQTFDTRKKKG